MSALYHEVRGSGPDLVLLHGWSLNLGVWESLARELATRFRIIAIDLPGHGDSPAKFQTDLVQQAIHNAKAFLGDGTIVEHDPAA